MQDQTQKLIKEGRQPQQSAQVSQSRRFKQPLFPQHQPYEPQQSQQAQELQQSEQPQESQYQEHPQHPQQSQQLQQPQELKVPHPSHKIQTFKSHQKRGLTKNDLNKMLTESIHKINEVKDFINELTYFPADDNPTKRYKIEHVREESQICFWEKFIGDVILEVKDDIFQKICSNVDKHHLTTIKYGEINGCHGNCIRRQFTSWCIDNNRQFAIKLAQKIVKNKNLDLLEILELLGNSYIAKIFDYDYNVGKTLIDCILEVGIDNTAYKVIESVMMLSDDFMGKYIKHIADSKRWDLLLRHNTAKRHLLLKNGHSKLLYDCIYDNLYTVPNEILSEAIINPPFALKVVKKMVVDDNILLRFSHVSWEIIMDSITERKKLYDKESQKFNYSYPASYNYKDDALLNSLVEFVRKKQPDCPSESNLARSYIEKYYLDVINSFTFVKPYAGSSSFHPHYKCMD